MSIKEQRTQLEKETDDKFWARLEKLKEKYFNGSTEEDKAKYEVLVELDEDLIKK